MTQQKLQYSIKKVKKKKINLSENFLKSEVNIQKLFLVNFLC